MRYTILILTISFLTLQAFGQDNTQGENKEAPKEKVAEPKKEKPAKVKKEKVAKEKATETKKEPVVQPTPEKAAAPKVQEKPEQKIEAKSKGPKAKVPYHFMANVHGGVGLMNYFGDLRDNPGTTVHRIGSHPGWNFGVGANVTNYLELNVDVLLAKLSWDQNQSLHDTPKNFESKVFTVGASLVYNFKNVILNPVGITPFVSVGVSYSDYSVYSDLQDGSGNVYYYWDDGLIRNVNQSSPATDDIKVLSRDYKYETRVSEYPIAAVSIPVGAGFDFNASRKFAIRLGSFYYFTTTDKMDNVSGGSKGFFSNDGFLYTSLSVFFKFDPFKKKAPKVDMAGADYADFGAVVDEDSDGDGVSDFNDRCGGTPKGLVVDEHGCPADEDADGIPDYRDKELKTPAGRIVDANGVGVSYQDIYKSYGSDTTSLLRKNVNEEWLYSQKSIDPKYTVHVGTYTNYDIPTQIKMRLAKMQGLVETKVNDSISVFTLGSYDNFEAAEKKQNELISSGIDEAFGVNEGAIPDVGVDLGVVGFDKARNQQPKGVSLDIEDVDVLSYGVELKEYRLRIELDKLSKLIAQHGVEMKSTTGGLKVYTIGSFKTFAEAEALLEQVISLGVKNPAVTAKFNNQEIDLDAAKEKESEMQQVTPAE
ncbi:MAG: hypothetical protein K9J17_07715 [Flavobacteriales bacterium]|nr:hypothetical protein [Flavobacteriales bacterium]